MTIAGRVWKSIGTLIDPAGQEGASECRGDPMKRFSILPFPREKSFSFWPLTIPY